MRKGFGAIRIFLFFAILAGTAGLFAFTRYDLALNNESRAFVQDTVAATGAHWDSEALLSHSTAHLREQAKALHTTFETASRSLGPLVEYRTVYGNNKFSLSGGSLHVVAVYVIEAAFQKGDAEIEVDAVKAGATWQIDNFQFGASEAARDLFGLKDRYPGKGA
jgi:hypothetical protein